MRVEEFVQPEPAHERLWMYGWSDPLRIRGREHLTVLLTRLSPDDHHADITEEATNSWAQVKRLGARWWVEGPYASEDWPGVFVPEAWLEERGRRRVDNHACWSHTMTAELVWAFFDRRTIVGVVWLSAPGGDHA